MAAFALSLGLLTSLVFAIPQPQQSDALQACGTARYHPSKVSINVTGPVQKIDAENSTHATSRISCVRLSTVNQP